MKKRILKLVKLFYKSQKAEVKFVPGKSYINYAGRVYDEKELINLVDASLDFWLTAGRYADRFEKDFAKYLGVSHCILTNSGSSANLLAISALTSPLLGDKRLRNGDEVITTACGFPTTLNPIIQNNLVPVFVDVKPGTYNANEDSVEKAVSAKTRAIFIAHTLGNPFNLEKVAAIAKKHGLWLIEDNCDALGSKYKGRYTGTFGHISTFSFYPAHHITMGEGGAVVTNEPLLRRAILSFRDWGRDCWCGSGHDNTCGNRFTQQFGQLPTGYDHKYVYSHIGYNLKVTEMQAAIGLAQLKKLNTFIRKRKDNYHKLTGFLKDFSDYLILPSVEQGADPSWFGLPILVKESSPFSRNDIVNHLESHKIATRMLFGGNLTKQPAYKGIQCRIFEGLENTDLVMNNLFWIGVYPGITAEKLEYIIKTFMNIFSSKR